MLLSFLLPRGCELKQKGINSLSFTYKSENKKIPSHVYSFYKSLANSLKGISVGYYSYLFLKGVGYRVNLSEGKHSLIFRLGFSHPIYIDPPKMIGLDVFKESEIYLSSHSLEYLGKFSSSLIDLRKRDPYKGKGVINPKGKFEPLKVGKKNK